MIGEEDLKKLMHAKNEGFQSALYDRYSCQVYGCFSSFCKDKSMALELMKRVFEQAEMEVKTTGAVQGKLSIWLLRISRKISREYLLDFSIKKSIEERCPVQLILCEGFSPKEAAGLLGISLVEVIGKLRHHLRG
ncbi:hypothetical protein DHW03_10570 [Pedobacter yonginense]|uniref:RNA polymerase sigma factor 70 region 4 type 2 domain-containing protein n=1 Tax=Pedobacter yonginense TaxID=651869 RepID=A0A317EP84_9SPHI|nr:hypothetical protein [Pedobacter yonginense]PWS27997.1 hypothetical protein DHW03_10570 [Pedobacter yonginense]